MEIFLNDNFLNGEQSDIESALKKVSQLYQFAKEKNITVYKRENDASAVLYANKLFQNNRKLVIPLGYLGKFLTIPNLNIYDLKPEDIDPVTFDNITREVLEHCYLEEIGYMLSIRTTRYVDFPEYYILRSLDNAEIEHIFSQEKLNDIYMEVPPIQSTKELFKRIENNYTEVKFTKKAYDSAKEREEMYRSFGYHRIVKMFQYAHNELFPYLLGKRNNENLSDEIVFSQFFQKTGIEISKESTATMQQYSKERTIQIDDKNIVFEIHLKINGDVRMYLKAVGEHIYFGHCGKHLRTKKYH